MPLPSDHFPIVGKMVFILVRASELNALDISKQQSPGHTLALALEWLIRFLDECAACAVVAFAHFGCFNGAGNLRPFAGVCLPQVVKHALQEFMQGAGLLCVNGHGAVITSNFGGHNGTISGHIMHRPVCGLCDGHITDTLALDGIASIIWMGDGGGYVSKAVCTLIGE